MASLLMPCGLHRFGRPTWRRRHSRPGARGDRGVRLTHGTRRRPPGGGSRALAHVVRNKVEAAYRRTDLFERRRWLMEDWAAYLADNRAAARHAHARER